MTENFASYGDRDKSAQARLARVQAALGCKTWSDLPVSLEAAAEGEDAALDWAQSQDTGAEAAASLEAAILRNILRCIPTSRIAAELKRRERERLGR